MDVHRVIRSEETRKHFPDRRVHGELDTMDQLAGSSDEQLARRAGLGDRDAYAELVRRTLPALLRYTRRMITDVTTADDVAQEVLLAAWKGLPQFGFRSSFRTWVFGIAHRKIIDIRRRRTELLDDELLSEIPLSEPGPGDSAVARSLLEALVIELSQIPHPGREVWWLREMEGLSHAEIAEIVGISPGSSRGYLQRTRARLAERMAPWRPAPTAGH